MENRPGLENLNTYLKCSFKKMFKYPYERQVWLISLRRWEAAMQSRV